MKEPDESAELQIVKKGEVAAKQKEIEEFGASLIAYVDALTAQIPGFAENHTVDTRAFIRRKVGVPPAFVRESVDALLVDGDLQLVPQLSAKACLAAKQYIDTFSPLRAHLRGVTRRLDFEIKLREAELTAHAQKIFGVAKALSRDDPTGQLAILVQKMSRKRRRPRRKRRAKKAE